MLPLSPLDPSHHFTCPTLCSVFSTSLTKQKYIKANQETDTQIMKVKIKTNKQRTDERKMSKHLKIKKVQKITIELFLCWQIICGHQSWSDMWYIQPV